MRVLLWNLKHGRSVPGSGRDLFAAFAAAISDWDWDAALLQEVPPWWSEPLAQHTEAQQRHVLTSRNSLLPVRRWVARRWPDLIKSNGGGCNAILVRGGSIRSHRTRRLSLLPERRWVHAVELTNVWLANLHTEASPEQARLAGSTVLEWAGSAPAVLGGDFNLRMPSIEGFEWAGGSGVDHVFLHGRDTAGSGVSVLDAGKLSDHAPVLVALPRTGSGSGS